MEKPSGYHVALIALGLLVLYAMWQAVDYSPLEFDEEGLANLGMVLAPLVAVAAFIERTVEVILTPTRGDTAGKLRHQLEVKKEAGADVGDLEEKIRDYSLGTRRYAFLLAVALGLVASMLGLRALENLVITPAGSPLDPAVQRFDMLLTGLVVGGGADGIHKPVKAFTDYMEMISRNAKKSS